MKLGFCADVSKLSDLKNAGIDALEMSVPAICAWSEDELRENLAAIRAHGLTFETCNSLIGGFSLYDDHDFSQTNAYFDRALPRLSAAGMKILVFGSGGYRRVPEGMEQARARERILEFLRLLSERITPYGLTAVIEPLNFGECNILNTSAEAADYVRTLNLENIRLLVDYYHFLLVGERLDAIANYRGLLAHTHAAHPVNRRTPARGDGIDYKGFIRVHKDIDYTGLIVAEPRVGADFSGEAIDFSRVMKRALQACGAES